MARVLVVEDNEDQRVQIVEGLRDAGHEVFEAEDGQVGYDLAMKTDNIDINYNTPWANRSLKRAIRDMFTRKGQLFCHFFYIYVWLI